MKKLHFFGRKADSEGQNAEIIQLVSCPANGDACLQSLAEINSLLSEARQSRFSKEYGLSVHNMKLALAIADGIEGERCLSCARLFRSTILQSMDSVKDELEEMSGGFFKKRYKDSYKEVSLMLVDLKEGKTAAKG